LQNLTNQSTVMIVDDTPANLKLLQDLLHARGYRVLAFPGGAMAIEAALRSPPDLILLDVNMPELNGYEVCARLKASPATREIPVLFISALGETSDKMKAFSAGGLDYVTKPFQFEEVHARVETHLRLHLLQRELEKYNLKLGELVQEKVKEISQSQLATIVAMSKLAESRDDDTGHHIERTRTFCRILAQKLGENPRHQRVIDDSFNPAETRQAHPRRVRDHENSRRHRGRHAAGGPRTVSQQLLPQDGGVHRPLPPRKIRRQRLSSWPWPTSTTLCDP